METIKQYYLAITARSGLTDTESTRIYEVPSPCVRPDRMRTWVPVQVKHVIRTDACDLAGVLGEHLDCTVRQINPVTWGLLYAGNGSGVQSDVYDAHVFLATDEHDAMQKSEQFNNRRALVRA